jgi:hypothetical protein
MVTSTVHEYKYIDIVEGSEHPYKCALCSKTYFEFRFETDVVRDHLLEAHYSAIGAAFDHDDDDDCDYEGAVSRMDLDACSDGRWEGPGDSDDYGASDSEDVQEREEEKEGDGDRSGAGNAGIDAAASAPTAMSWPERKKEDVDEAVARWFYAHLIPFNVSRNPYFKEMIEALAKAERNYVTPSPSRLNSLLTDEQKNAILKRKKAMNKKRKISCMW